MAGNDDVMRAIGQLEGKIDSVISNQHRHDLRILKLDGRMAKVETKAAINGAVSGSIVSVGIAITIASLKGLFHHGA